MDKVAKIYVAGHRGMVGSAIVRCLKEAGYENLVLRTREELNLFDMAAVREFYATEKPEYVIDCAARVGGIKASSTHQAEFLYENLQIQNSVIWGAKEAGVKKLLFLGSSCIYPADCPQPMNEDSLMEGKPEITCEGYAIAKIAGMQLCDYIYDEFGMNFISCMPTNLYGENDDLNPETSHVIPALLRRFHDAKIQNAPEVVIWGTGVSRREFLHVDDLADAALWLMENYNEKQFLNVGTGEDISIRELAEAVKKLVGYEGKLVFDSTKPDGMPKKLLDMTRMHNAGWHHKISFEDGLKKTYKWYLENM